MSVLYLQVRHGKTGSSFIQSSLAAASDRLREQRIIYPDPGRLTHAAEGGISSGNGALLVHALKSRAYRRHPSKLCSTHHVLFSAEQLFDILLNPDMPRHLDVFAGVRNFSKIKMLLFIRDPISHAASLYQQQVKRHGFTGAVEAFFALYDVPSQVERFLDTFLRAPGVTLTILNYSANKDHILPRFSEWLGVHPGTLKHPPVARVNRSLTRAELEFQKELNKVLVNCGSVLADPLCEKLPGIRSEKVRPDTLYQEKLWDRLRPAIQRINEQLDGDQHYPSERDIRPPPDVGSRGNENFMFIRDLVARSIGGEILASLSEHGIEMNSSVRALEAQLEAIEARLRIKSSSRLKRILPGVQMLRRGQYAHFRGQKTFFADVLF